MTVIVTVTDVVTVTVSQTETLGLSIHTGLEHTYGRPCLSQCLPSRAAPGQCTSNQCTPPGCLGICARCLHPAGVEGNSRSAFNNIQARYLPTFVPGVRTWCSYPVFVPGVRTRSPVMPDVHARCFKMCTRSQLVAARLRDIN